MRIRYTPILLLLSSLSVGRATAQLADRAVPALTSMRTDGIHVDGVLDEADWARAEVATDFVNYVPEEGKRMSQRTEVRVLHGPDALYLGAVLHESDPSQIRRILTRRDDLDGPDTFIAAFDSYNDRKTAYLFGVTAAGVQFDALLTANGDDDSWDAVWDSAVRIGSDGWIVEMAIPYSQLRFTEGSTTWGVEFQRQIRRTGEEAYWAPITSDQSISGLVQLFGKLEGMEGITPRRTVQIVPYTLARANTFEDSDIPGSPRADYHGDLGADFRVGLSSNVTLDAAVNPDFGQVEADPAELNLTTFETFFQERRPFFLEGTQIFDFTYGSGDGALLYTRRVGGEAPIIGATKISGRLANGMSFGVLGATTGDDFAPGRYYAAARVKQEFGNQNYIGGALTGYAFDPRSSSAAPVRTVVGGADWDWRVGRDAGWKFEGSLAGSARNVDDPNLDDPTREGYALYVGFDKVKGFVAPGSGLRVYSPDFEINDVGRFRQTNLVQGRLGGNVIWNQNEPFGPFLHVETGGYFDQNWSYDDDTYRGGSYHVFGFGRLNNFWSASVSGNVSNVGGFDVRETRGLGPISNIRQIGVNVGIDSDERKRLYVGPQFGIQFGEDGGTSVGGGVGVSWNASDRIELSSTAAYQVSDNATAWTANEGFVRTDTGFLIGSTTTTPDNLAEADLVDLNETDIDALLSGVSAYDADLLVPNATGYYLPVFGDRDTRNFSVSTRANVIFTPKLSLQLYSQVFAARGRYSNFSILANPDELRPFDYPKRPDFAFEAFQANVVLRWEYRPGSTVFLVWTQSRNLNQAERLLLGDALPPSPFDRTTGDQLRDTFTVFPDNVFLIKLNYMFQR